MSNTDTRAEHLAWCKERALAYVEQGDLNNAFASLISDLRKHPETEDGRVETVEDVTWVCSSLLAEPVSPKPDIAAMCDAIDAEQFHFDTGGGRWS